MKNDNLVIKTTRITEECHLLMKAKQDKDFKLVLKLANSLAPTLEDAYYSFPEIFENKIVNSTLNYIRRLKRAKYIKQPKHPIVYKGGSPGLGKKN